jgi:cyclohexyl-isocyanide hydratase
MIIGIPVYQGVNLLDVAGPYEMFNWIPKNKPDTVIVSENGCPVTTMNNVTIQAHCSFADLPALDILWVPGGSTDALSREMEDPSGPYLSYLKQVAAKATWVCSVCEGAMLLARAGLLDGHQATTHWAFVNCLKSFPKIEVDETNPRFVVSGNRLTGGGISSGLDEALKLIWLIAGEAAALSVQRTTQYFPEPPVTQPKPSPPAPPCPFSW